ncbi:DUF1330 domain-containing protein [Roseomonas sp. CAU 1739]|uniref:DUF1330 domain-containing protein n=1 Tax=Roseomonas sp. CAU 1739 TaxID=3140364 RepID=UPI00325BD0EA
MHSHLKLSLAMTAGFALGAAVSQGLRAQQHPPAYVISEIEVTDAEAYLRDYVPLANRALAENGQRRLASGGRTVTLAGAPPATRVVVSVFDSLEKAEAAYTSPAYLEARRIGDRYGRLRIFAVEGLPQ